jgi:hypothetical protein
MISLATQLTGRKFISCLVGEVTMTMTIIVAPPQGLRPPHHLEKVPLPHEALFKEEKDWPSF